MSISWTTGEVTLDYPKLDAYDDFGKLSTICLLPEQDAESLIKIVASEAEDRFKGKLPKNFSNPLKDGNEKMIRKKRFDNDTGEVVETEEQDPRYSGKMYCRASTTEIVAVIDAKGEEVKDLKKIKSGVKAKVSLEARAYDHMGNRGVTLKLIAIQLVDDNAILGS